MELTKEQLAGLRKRINSVTRDFEKKHFAKKIERKKKGKEAVLQKTLNSLDFGCHNKPVAELISAVTGYKLFSRTTTDTRINFVQLLAVVPLKNQFEGHDYELNAVSIAQRPTNSSTHSGLVREEGTIGNAMTRVEGYFRPATAKEINKLKSVQLTFLAEKAGLVFL